MYTSGACGYTATRWAKGGRRAAKLRKLRQLVTLVTLRSSLPKYSLRMDNRSVRTLWACKTQHNQLFWLRISCSWQRPAILAHYYRPRNSCFRPMSSYSRPRINYSRPRNSYSWPMSNYSAPRISSAGPGYAQDQLFGQDQLF